MTYNEATLRAVRGDTLMLPNFIGYFKWNYGLHYLEFTNGDYRCKAEDLGVQKRNDWYYII